MSLAFRRRARSVDLHVSLFGYGLTRVGSLTVLKLPFLSIAGFAGRWTIGRGRIA